MKLFYFAIVFSLLHSCKNQYYERASQPITLQVDQVYKTGGSMAVGDKRVDMAYHYLILKEYNEADNSSWNNFIEFADSYRDTVALAIPLSSITICKPYKITTNLAGGEGWDEFTEHQILTINYSHQTMHETLADISGLTFWKNGEPYSVNLLTDERLKQGGKYFDSSDKYSEKWWDRYKSQLPVDHETDSL
jgi:hypothetical protein